jgi:hypothetical protein
MRIDGNSTDAVTGVKYGGVALSTAGLAQDNVGEPGLCHAWFLGSGVPTGAQTVQVTTTAGTWNAGAITVASAGNTQVIGETSIEGDGTLSEQNVNDGSPGSPSMRYAGGFTGLNSPPAVGSNSTSLQSIDNGTDGVVICRETTAGQGSRPVGWSSATTDDRAFVHLAIKEV